MNKEILLIVQSISNERGVKEDVIFEAIESALAAVRARRFPGEALVRVDIDRKTGEYDSFRCWAVVEDSDEPLELPEQQIYLSQARKIDPNLQVGDVVEEEIESEKFGRIAAQQAKQVIIQKVREAERAKIARLYQKRVGELLIGVVKRVTREFIVLDMGENAEAFLAREEMIPREVFRVNDRVRVYLYEVQEERRGPQLLVSRTRPE